jgi:hypothetical protein
MWGNNNKDTKLRHAELRLLLKQTGFAESHSEELPSFALTGVDNGNTD